MGAPALGDDPEIRRPRPGRTPCPGDPCRRPAPGGPPAVHAGGLRAGGGRPGQALPHPARPRAPGPGPRRPPGGPTIPRQALARWPPPRASGSSPRTCPRSSAPRSCPPPPRPARGGSDPSSPRTGEDEARKDRSPCPRNRTIGSSSSGAARRASPSPPAWPASSGGPDITVIEPSAKHYYQPLWTLVGAGVFPKQASERDEADFIPKGATWVRDAVAEFRPDENLVTTRGGAVDRLRLSWSSHRASSSTGARSRASRRASAPAGFAAITTTARWTTPGSASAASGAARPCSPTRARRSSAAGRRQKIMYLADDHFRKAGVRDRFEGRVRLGLEVHLRRRGVRPDASSG